MASGPWWRIGWRNLGRNQRRTLITAAGLAFGYLAVVVLIGLMDGLTVDIGWSDVGSFAALYDIQDKDENGNAMIDEPLVDAIEHSWRITADGRFVIERGECSRPDLPEQGDPPCRRRVDGSYRRDSGAVL